MDDIITVDFDALSRIMGQMKTAGSQLQNAETQLKRLRLERSAGAYQRIAGSIRLRSVGRQFSTSTVAEAIQACGMAARMLEGYSARLGQGVSQTAELFRALERELRHNVTGIETGGEETTGGGAFSIDSILFDSDGSYGGNQGSMADIYRWDPIRCWELLGYLREYFPGMSIMAAFGYFDHLNSVGCGYVALANSLFMEYEGRPKEFERTFGFPMYNHGDLNYDRLILDIYATTDLSGMNDGTDRLPNGVLETNYTEIMQNYMAEQGLTARSETSSSMTANDLRRISEEGGHVVLTFREGNLYDANGNVRQYLTAHAMTVTGVTDDGRYIVSSWGEEYYINAADIGDNDTFFSFYYDS